MNGNSQNKIFAQFARRSLIDQVSTKLKLVLAVASAARRESAEAVKKLEEQIKTNDKEQVIEKVAYIWFNQICALRFMDMNRYICIWRRYPAISSPLPGTSCRSGICFGKPDFEVVGC